MNKKGFTLIELLAVIVLLGIIMLIAFPSIGGVSDTVKKKMLNTKLEMIEESAVLYGQDFFKGSLVSTTTKYKDYSCRTIDVKKLVEQKYLDADNDAPCIENESSGVEGCVVDPSDDTEYLDNKEIIIYYQNKRIKAVVDYDNNLECK